MASGTSNMLAHGERDLIELGLCERDDEIMFSPTGFSLPRELKDRWVYSVGGRRLARYVGAGARSPLGELVVAVPRFHLANRSFVGSNCGFGIFQLLVLLTMRNTK